MRRRRATGFTQRCERQDVLRTAIRLAGNCHAAYLKVRPPMRGRFNDAVLEAVYIKDRNSRAEFSEVFAAPLLSPELEQGPESGGEGI